MKNTPKNSRRKSKTVLRLWKNNERKPASVNIQKLISDLKFTSNELKSYHEFVATAGSRNVVELLPNQYIATYQLSFSPGVVTYHACPYVTKLDLAGGKRHGRFPIGHTHIRNDEQFRFMHDATKLVRRAIHANDIAIEMLEAGDTDIPDVVVLSGPLAPKLLNQNGNVEEVFFDAWSTSVWPQCSKCGRAGKNEAVTRRCKDTIACHKRRVYKKVSSSDWIEYNTAMFTAVSAGLIPGKIIYSKPELYVPDTVRQIQNLWSKTGGMGMKMADFVIASLSSIKDK